MDTTTLDVTNIANVALGDEVVLLGSQGTQQITIGDIIGDSGFTMSNCQLVYKTGGRVKREYIGCDRLTDKRMVLLEQVCEQAPAVARVLNQERDSTLRAYMENLSAFQTPEPLQDRTDIAKTVKKHLLPIVGEQLTTKAVAGIEGELMTANHHGVDYFAQSVQGNLLFRELLKNRGYPTDAVALMACSGVPLDNSSYGKGITVYNTLDEDSPVRIPIVPKRKSDAIVGLYPAMDSDQIRSALRLLTHEKYGGRLSNAMKEITAHVLEDIYLSDAVQSCTSYSQQATLINAAMTKEAFGTSMLYIDAEKIASTLLQIDLGDCNSLAYRVLFDVELRCKTLEKLEGCTGCWDRKKLAVSDTCMAGGTVFFWASEKYGRVALTIDGDTLRNTRSGERIALRPEEIKQRLKDGDIYPSIMMTFLEICFARGSVCFGGCFQPSYLKRMQEGLTQALCAVHWEKAAHCVQTVPASAYLSGPIFFKMLSDAGRRIPVGILEFLGHGKDSVWMEKALETDLNQAHLDALMNLYPDVIPAARRLPDWKKLLV